MDFDFEGIWKMAPLSLLSEILSQKIDLGIYFLNVNFSETMVNTDFKFCLLILHIYPEGTCLRFLIQSFILMSKNGKQFIQFVNIIF